MARCSRSEPDLADFPITITEEFIIAKPNYNFEKRQRELKKQKKLEAKREKKLARQNGSAAQAQS